MSLFDYRKTQMGKYKMFLLRFGYLKFEWCFFKKQFMFRIEFNNWDK